MFEKKSVQTTRVLIFLDGSLTILSFFFAFWLRNVFWLRGIVFTPFEADLVSHLALAPLVLVLQYFFMNRFGAYGRLRNANFRAYAIATIKGVACSMGILLSLIFALKIYYVSRGIIVIFACVNMVLLILIRVALLHYFKISVKRGKYILHVLIIGTGERAKNLALELQKQSDWGIHIVGCIDPDPTRVGTRISGIPVLGVIKDISKILKNHVVDEVIMAIPRTMIEDVEEIAYACEEEGVVLRFMANIFELDVAKIHIMFLGDAPFLTIEPVSQDDFKLMIKRMFDLAWTLLAIPVILPIMAVIAIAIKIESKGPIFYIQKRVGLKKRLFPMLKFRSMYVGSEEKLKDIIHLNEAEGPIFKMKNDPRVTGVGRWIRKTSLDELPQLINVITGDMSLVGPRPMSVRDVSLFDKGIQRKRFSVKPGITCLWQISGRSNLPFSKWLELDLHYIKNWSLWLDFVILIKTIPVVLKGEGAA